MIYEKRHTLASAVHTIEYSVAKIEVLARLMHGSGPDIDETDIRAISQIIEDWNLEIRKQIERIAGEFRPAPGGAS